jgi:ABC-type glycerol-3-phosphate transport system permease component
MIATAAARESRRAAIPLKRVVVYLTLVVYLVIVLIPIYWMFRSAITDNSELYGEAIAFFPDKLTLAQFSEGINKWHFGTYLKNSIIVATCSTTLTVIMSSLAAYSLVRLRYPGRAALARSILFVYLVPGGFTFIPLFIIMSSLHLLNTLFSLIITYLSFGIPFCTWMLIGYFRGIGPEMEEAALIDGCSRLQSLRLVLLPLAAPGLAAAAIFSFTLAWNEFLYALILISSESLRTLPPGIANLVRGDIYLFGPMMAGSVMAAIPVMLLYMLAQRFVVQGLAAGAIKG